MARAGVTLLCHVLLVAAGGLRLCQSVELLRGLNGQSLSFPALQVPLENVARVTWRFKGTHIAEAKPREMKFSTDFLPSFRHRLQVQPKNLSLKILHLKRGDTGTYEVVVDTFSNPTTPKTFRYYLVVSGPSAEVTTQGGDTRGHPRSTRGPQEVTEPHAGDPTAPGPDGGQPPETGGTQCGDHYCLLRGYLTAAILGPLLVLVATTHFITRDKATKMERDTTTRG